MIEKYRMSQDHIRRCFRVVRFDNRTVAYCDKQDDAIKLCAKLNRLAALEKVCQEIVDNAALEKHSSSFSTAFLKGSEVSERHIAQKLKAVLEEA